MLGRLEDYYMQKNNTPHAILEQEVCKFKMQAARFFDDCEFGGISIQHHATLSKIKFWIGEEILARFGGAK